MFLCDYIYICICFFFSSLSLSLYISTSLNLYLYIYTYILIYVYIYIYLQERGDTSYNHPTNHPKPSNSCKSLTWHWISLGGLAQARHATCHGLRGFTPYVDFQNPMEFIRFTSFSKWHTNFSLASLSIFFSHGLFRSPFFEKKQWVLSPKQPRDSCWHPL